MNQVQRKHHATRSLVAPKVLTLLGRAKGLDILVWSEQSNYETKTIDMNAAGEVSDMFAQGAEIVGFDSEAGTADFQRLSSINYPVPGFMGYDVS